MRSPLVAVFASLAVATSAAAADPIDVTIDGDPLLPGVSDPTVSATVVGRDALAQPGLSAADAIDRVPSVRVARTGSGADLATIGLRGTSNAETPVYLAGVRLNDEISGTADLSTVPLFFLRRMVVYRGGAPLELAGQGLGGVVVFEPELPASTHAEAGFGMGSFGERSASGAVTFGTGKAAAAFAVRADHTDGDYLYLDDRGTRFVSKDDRLVRRKNADATTLDAWGIGRARLGERGSLVIVSNALAREQGLTGLGIVPATSARADTKRGLFAIEARVRCSTDPHSDDCVLTAQAFGKASSSLYSDPERELPIGATRQEVDGDSAGYRLSVRARGLRWLTLSGGAEQSFDLLGVDPIGPAELRARKIGTRAFAGADFDPLPWARFELGGSVASEKTSGPGPDGNLLVPQARTGVSVAPIPELAFYGNIARYERTPTLGESYGVSAVVLGNPDLRAEKGPSFEVGTRFARAFGKSVSLAAEGAFFYRSAKDLIAYRRTSFGVLRPYNVGDAHVLGGELTAATELARAFRVDGALTLTDARDDGVEALGSGKLPFEPTVVADIGVRFHRDQLVPAASLGRLELGTTFTYRAPRAADPAGLVELGAERSWSADAALGLARDMLTLRFRVTNLLDDAATDLVGYPLPGRAFHASLEAVWP